MPIQSERYNDNPNTAPPLTQGSGQPPQERPTETESSALTTLIESTSNLPEPITVLSAGT